MARWRASCVRDAQSIVTASESKVRAQVDEARKQQGWWEWAVKGSQVVETAVWNKIEEQGGAHTLFSDDETAFMSNIVRVCNRYSNGV